MIAKGTAEAAYGGAVMLRTMQNAKNDDVKAVNGNSKASTKAQHVYGLINKKTNKIEKVGISGGKISKAGKSYRANKQISEQKKLGFEFSQKIIKKIKAGEGARVKALEAEVKATNNYKNTINPRIHSRPKPE